MDQLKKVSTKGLSKTYNLDKYPVGFQIVFRAYIQGALRKGLSFNATPGLFMGLMHDSCYYCGGDPSNETLDFIYNGIDRLRTDEGYTSSNIVPCCALCNSMKSKLTAKQFIDHVELIYRFKNH